MKNIAPAQSTARADEYTESVTTFRGLLVGLLLSVVCFWIPVTAGAVSSFGH